MYKTPQLMPATSVQRPARAINISEPLDLLAHNTLGQIFSAFKGRPKNFSSILEDVARYDSEYRTMGDGLFDLKIIEIKSALRRDGFNDALVAQAFACARDATGRSLGMYHFDSQVLGGLAIFFGNIAEMQTGEGKTLTAILPASVAALSGVPVHVITVNDYLAARDAEEMRPAYERLGLSVGCVVQGMTVPERQRAYACDVVYCTNSELVFDYLKDEITLGSLTHSLSRYAQCIKGTGAVSEQLMLRGLHFAVIDEVDSVMLDEARTPLIISGEAEPNLLQNKIYIEAMIIASMLQQDTHFRLDKLNRSVTLLTASELVIDEKCRSLGNYWIGKIRRIELIHKALTAIYLYQREDHYLVRDGKVQIIDENTGRLMPDRSWEQGLHQLIEIKEDCEQTSPRETLAKISYQRFFRMYLHCGGMTGTAAEVARELWSVYALAVVKIPSHKPNQRRYLGAHICLDKPGLLAQLSARIEALYLQNRAVLVGTTSVMASEELSRLLQQRNIPHQLLSAKHDSDEARVVAEAGKAGKITIATSMAGRGTDIKLEALVKSAGGLHVIITELHDSARIDRQLEGRSARQGDPGSYEMILSLTDIQLKSIFSRFALHYLAKGLCHRFGVIKKCSNYLGLWLLQQQQRDLQKQHVVSRRQLLKQDEQQRKLLAFATNKNKT